MIGENGMGVFTVTKSSKKKNPLWRYGKMVLTNSWVGTPTRRKTITLEILGSPDFREHTPANAAKIKDLRDG